MAASPEQHEAIERKQTTHKDAGPNHLLDNKELTAAQKNESIARRLAESADFQASKTNADGMSWRATREALERVGIKAPHASGAADIQSIDGMTRLGADEKPKPGDVYTTGASEKFPYGYSFTVNEDGKAVAGTTRRFPDLTQYTDVKHFRVAVAKD